jgi:hypothetical protein
LLDALQRRVLIRVRDTKKYWKLVDKELEDIRDKNPNLERAAW